MIKSNIKLGLFERVLLFSGFVIIVGVLIGAYAWIDSLHAPKSIAIGSPTTKPVAARPLPVEPKSMVLDVRPPLVIHPPQPATRPSEIVVMKPAEVEIKIEPPPAPVAAKPEEVIEIKPVLLAKPTSTVKPYAVPLISAKVIESIGDASDDMPYRYHVKIDPAEIELLRAMLAQAGRHDGLQADEFDHVAAEPAATDLPWWKPAKLVDVSVMALAPKTDSTAKLWSAISNKTGDVLVYSVKPVDFTRHAEARSSD